MRPCNRIVTFVTMKNQPATSSGPRHAQRVDVALPVRLADSVGLTRDVSGEGIYFEMDAAAETGSVISFAIEMPTPLGAMTLKCSGLVVRNEQRAGRFGIAVRILDSRLDAQKH